VAVPNHVGVYTKSKNEICLCLGSVTVLHVQISGSFMLMLLCKCCDDPTERTTASLTVFLPCYLLVLTLLMTPEPNLGPANLAASKTRNTVDVYTVNVV